MVRRRWPASTSFVRWALPAGTSGAPGGVGRLCGPLGGVAQLVAGVGSRIRAREVAGPKCR
jgi:hypothetical protein